MDNKKDNTIENNNKINYLLTEKIVIRYILTYLSFASCVLFFNMVKMEKEIQSLKNNVIFLNNSILNLSNMLQKIDVTLMKVNSNLEYSTNIHYINTAIIILLSCMMIYIIINNPNNNMSVNNVINSLQSFINEKAKDSEHFNTLLAQLTNSHNTQNINHLIQTLNEIFNNSGSTDT
jgi:superfamily II RNA helicase